MRRPSPVWDEVWHLFPAVPCELTEMSPIPGKAPVVQPTAVWLRPSAFIRLLDRLVLGHRPDAPLVFRFMVFPHFMGLGKEKKTNPENVSYHDSKRFQTPQLISSLVSLTENSPCHCGRHHRLSPRWGDSGQRACHSQEVAGLERTQTLIHAPGSPSVVGTCGARERMTQRTSEASSGRYAAPPRNQASRYFLRPCDVAQVASQAPLRSGTRPQGELRGCSAPAAFRGSRPPICPFQTPGPRVHAPSPAPSAGHRTRNRCSGPWFL